MQQAGRQAGKQATQLVLALVVIIPCDLRIKQCYGMLAAQQANRMQACTLQNGDAECWAVQQPSLSFAVSPEVYDDTPKTSAH
jgi:hypothetical protein